MKIALAFLLVAVSSSLDPVSALLGLDTLLPVGNLPTCLPSLLGTVLPQLVQKIGELGCALKDKDPARSKEKTINILKEVQHLLKGVTCLAPIAELVTAILNDLVEGVNVEVGELVKKLDEIVAVAGLLGVAGSVVCNSGGGLY
ncbi:uncharacterized protein LOC144766955 isoform X1 [Lissotriton helveticus]